MWAGIDGGPQTTLLYFDKYFEKKKAGLAVVLYDDKTGPTSRSGGQVNLSYSIEMKEGRRLMFGLAGTLMQYKLDKAALAAYIDDPLIAGASENTMKGDAAAGIYYKSPTLNFGVSVQQLVQAHPSHLLRATIYARAGLLDEAEREYQALLNANPRSTIARKLLQHLRAQRKS